MTRPAKVLLAAGASIALAALATACGTQRIEVASTNPLHDGALLFNQRCAGCHTLSRASTNGSASNVRSAMFNNGPNFDVRCERPVARVLYAIENGGFSGQIMPQNIVVGPDATAVAKFVATYAGTKAPHVPGTVVCNKQPVGAIPSTSTSTSTTSTSASTSTTSTSAAKAGAKKRAAAQKKKK